MRKNITKVVFFVYNCVVIKPKIFFLDKLLIYVCFVLKFFAAQIVISKKNHTITVANHTQKKGLLWNTELINS